MNEVVASPAHAVAGPDAVEADGTHEFPLGMPVGALR